MRLRIVGTGPTGRGYRGVHRANTATITYTAVEVDIDAEIADGS